MTDAKLKRGRGRPATGRTEWVQRTLLLTPEQDRRSRVLAKRRGAGSVAAWFRMMVDEAAAREGIE